MPEVGTKTRGVWLKSMRVKMRPEWNDWDLRCYTATRSYVEGKKDHQGYYIRKALCFRNINGWVIGRIRTGRVKHILKYREWVKQSAHIAERVCRSDNEKNELEKASWRRNNGALAPGVEGWGRKSSLSEWEDMVSVVKVEKAGSFWTRLSLNVVGRTRHWHVPVDIEGEIEFGDNRRWRHGGQSSSHEWVSRSVVWMGGRMVKGLLQIKAGFRKPSEVRESCEETRKGAHSFLR